jgi:hypothetical protein
MRRHRTRLQNFVQVIKEHADDAAKASLLTDLSVKMSSRYDPVWIFQDDPQGIFALEELTPLRGIKNVEVGGEVPAWFAKCLQCCIQGHGGDVKEQNYPLVEVKQKKKKGTGFAKKPKWVETKQWYSPRFDWADFAERNGIELPEDFGTYYAIRGRAVVG